MTTARLRYAAIAASFLATSAWAGPTTLIDEGFEDFSGLAGAGWVIKNESTPLGSTSFFAGQTVVFSAQAGSAGSYAAANYNSAQAGGLISTWLMTPMFSTAEAVTVSFWARADIFDPFFDQIVFGFSDGSSDTAAFAVGQTITLTGDWTQYSATILKGAASSMARFAIGYVGNADDANFIGIDTLAAKTVPEPSTWLLSSLALLGVAGLRRRPVAAI